MGRAYGATRALLRGLPKRIATLIDPDGRVAAHYPSVSPTGIHQTALDDLDRLIAERG